MSSQLTPLVLLVVLLVVFWLVVLRPARTQQRNQQALQRGLEVGDDVVLSSGIFGVITAIDDAQVRLEVAPGTELRVARQVVVRRVEDDAEPVADVPGGDVADQHDDTRPVAEPEPEPEVAGPEPEPEPVVTKAPAKKAPAKRAPAKKTAAKKTTTTKRTTAKRTTAAKAAAAEPVEPAVAEPEGEQRTEDAERG